MKMPTNTSTLVLRAITCELGHLARPDGSSVLHQGDTSVISAVYGPTEVRINKEQIDRATVDVIYKPKSGLPGCADKAFEKTIRNTCESVLLTALHPRSSVNVIIQEVQDAGSFLATCINSACLALLDASVNMKCTMAAVSCCVNADDNIILDPTTKEERSSMAILTFVFDSNDRNVITVSAYGKYTAEQFQKCLITCREASTAVFEFYKDSIKRKLSKAI